MKAYRINICNDGTEHDLRGGIRDLFCGNYNYEEIEDEAELDELRTEFRARCEALHNRTKKKVSSDG